MISVCIIRIAYNSLIPATPFRLFIHYSRLVAGFVRLISKVTILYKDVLGLEYMRFWNIYACFNMISESPKNYHTYLQRQPRSENCFSTMLVAIYPT